MRKHLLPAISIFLFSLHPEAVPVSAPAIILPGKTLSKEILLKKISTLKIRDIQKLTGKKLSLKQRIAFLVLKHQFRRQADDKQNPGQTAFIIGIVGLGLLILGLFVPYVILGSIFASILAIVLGSSAQKKDPADRKAHAAKLLGWITLGVTLIALIIAVIIVAASLSSFNWI